MPTLSSTLSVGDYGCSQGKNSMAIINLIFNELKSLENVDKIENIRVYHEDLPDNDFNEVKKCVEDLEFGYLNHDLIKSKGIKIDPYYIGKSYYQQIVDKETLDIQFSYSTINWQPTYYPTPYGLIYSPEYDNPELTAKFNELATGYFTKYLNLRYDELKSGGLTIFNFINRTDYIFIVNEAWGKALKKLGLEQSNFDKVSIPTYYLQIENLKAILDSFSSKFELIYFEKTEQETSFTRPAVRALSKNQIISGLNEYPELSNDFKNELYDLFEGFMFENDDIVKLEGVMSFVILKKI